MEHDLQVEIVSESFLEPKGGLIGLFKISVDDMLWDFACQTGGRNDQTFAVFFEKFRWLSRFAGSRSVWLPCAT